MGHFPLSLDTAQPVLGGPQTLAKVSFEALGLFPSSTSGWQNSVPCSCRTEALTPQGHSFLQVPTQVFASSPSPAEQSLQCLMLI
jgi:hypothetical protein